MPSNLLDMSALTAFPMILANADQGSILMGAICTSVMRIRSSPPPLTKSSWIFKAYSSCREIGPVVLTVALCFKRYIGSFSFLKNNPHRPVKTRGDIGGVNDMKKEESLCFIDTPPGSEDQNFNAVLIFVICFSASA